ncbi:MAG: MarR family transcriptional regulator [Chloroflexi bacterium]|nr:MarR family transcriptional regulator [Chloroflexota bacterium]
MDFETADALNRAIRLIGLKHRARAAELLGEIGLHPGQEIVLLELDAHGARTQIQLAIGCECEPPTLTQLAQKLEAAGLISRQPSPTDARATVVSLTEQGQALVGPLKERWVLLAERTVAGLTRTTADALTEVTRDLASSLSCGGGRRRLARKLASVDGRLGPDR